MANKSGDLSWEEKDIICTAYGLHIKYKEQLLKLPDMYSDKIIKIGKEKDKEKEKYKELIDKKKIKEKDLEDLNGFILLGEKSIRLEDKQQAVLWEIEGRDLGYFKRQPHGTIYYIDLNAGNDGNTGLTIAQAWRTIEQYTTTTIRTAGDIAYIRANTTEILANIVNFDEDGDEDDRIYIIGCDTTIDPWGDGSNVRPILNANAGAFYLYFLTDDFWTLDNLDIRGSSDRIFYVNIAYNNELKNIDIHDNGNYGIYLINGSNLYVYKGNFYNNTNYSLYSANAGIIKIIESVFNAGVGGTNYGIHGHYGGGRFEIVDSSFGQTTAHAQYDINTIAGGNLFLMRDCIYNSINIGIWDNYSFSEDDNQVFGASVIRSYAGTITKDTAIKTGAADFSLKFEPNTNCGLNFPLKAEEHELLRSNFVANGIANMEITCTIKIRSLGVWAAYPTTDELYIEASYLDNAGDCGRSVIQSTKVLVDETTWQEFSVTFTPLRSGPVYVNVYLKKYEANKGCYVNGWMDVE